MRGRNRTRSDRHGREASAGSRRPPAGVEGHHRPRTAEKKEKIFFLLAGSCLEVGRDPGEGHQPPRHVQRRNTPKDFFHRQEAAKRERKPLYLWA